MNKVFSWQDDMCHALGLTPLSVLRPAGVGKRQVRSSRNYFYTTVDNKFWQGLVSEGLAIGYPSKDDNPSHYTYRVTRKGVQALEEKYGVKIVQDREDIIE